MQTRYSRSNIHALGYQLAPNPSSEACVRASQQQHRRGLGGAAVVAERGLSHEMPMAAASKNRCSQVKDENITEEVLYIYFL